MQPKKLQKKKFPPKPSLPKWKPPFKQFEKYVTKVIVGLQKGGLTNKHTVDLSLIIYCFADNLSVADCLTAYFKSLQLKLQFEKDTQKEQMPWCMEFANHVKNAQKDK